MRIPGIMQLEWAPVAEIRALKQGGMAELILVESDFGFGIRKKWVLKRILEKFRTDQLCRNFFIEEAQIHSELEHPNIVQFFSYGSDHNGPYMALEFVDGGNLSWLSKRLIGGDRESRLRLGLKALAQISSALAQVHQKFIHHDISPANILYSKAEFFKLCDFGVSKPLSGGLERLGSHSHGKVRYMSPEQLTGAQTDLRSDIFSLGVCFAEFFSGIKPYGDLRSDQISSLVRKGSYLKYLRNLDLPEPCTALIARCVHPAPNDRFQTALDLHDAVMGLQRSLPQKDVLAVAPRACRLPVSTETKCRKLSKVISIALSLPILPFIPLISWVRRAGIYLNTRNC